MQVNEPADEVLVLRRRRGLVTTMEGRLTESSSLEDWFPRYDVAERHETVVDASAERTYWAVRNVDLGRSPLVLALMAIRGLPHLITGKAKLSRRLTMDSLTGLGFVVLSEAPPSEIVLGAVGRFWQLDSGLIPFGAAEFTSFDEPGYAKAAMNFIVEPIDDGRSTVVTETRIVCTDAESLRKFKLYWRVIGPFSGLIRRIVLGRIKREAEA